MKDLHHPRARIKGESFAQVAGQRFGKTCRKMFCPECLTRLSDNIIRLRDGLFQCRRCGTLWTK